MLVSFHFISLITITDFYILDAVDLTAPEGGRYMERTQWSDYMYAAFSGPQ